MKKVNTQRLSDLLDELAKANANYESITVALMGSIAANLASIADSLEKMTEADYGRDAMEKARQESHKLSLKDVYEVLDDLEREDIEAYGCKIPEGFDAERAKEAIKNKFDGGMI